MRFFALMRDCAREHASFWLKKHAHTVSSSRRQAAGRVWESSQVTGLPNNARFRCRRGRLFFLLFYFSANLVLSYNCHRVLTHTPLAFLAIVISSRHCLLCRRRRHHHRVIIVVVVVVHVVIFFLSSFERRSPSILRRLFEQFFSQCIF